MVKPRERETMLNLKIIKNSIADVLLTNDALRVPRTKAQLVEDIYWIVAVASWEHEIGDDLTLEDLTDEECRLVTEWYFYNRGRYIDGDRESAINFLRDMRDIFPGLTLRTAYNLIRFIARASSMCPFCGKTVHESDFHDIFSVEEFYISGMCQGCQDDFFTE